MRGVVRGKRSQRGERWSREGLAEVDLKCYKIGHRDGVVRFVSE